MGLVNSIYEPPNYAALPIALTSVDEDITKGKYSLFVNNFIILDGWYGCLFP
jgi:hypothetical protein